MVRCLGDSCNSCSVISMLHWMNLNHHWISVACCLTLKDFERCCFGMIFQACNRVFCRCGDDSRRIRTSKQAFYHIQLTSPTNILLQAVPLGHSNVLQPQQGRVNQSHCEPHRSETGAAFQNAYPTPAIPPNSAATDPVTQLLHEPYLAARRQQSPLTSQVH